MKKKNLFRKMAIMTAFAFLGTSAMAEEYHYLTFETTDGAKASVEISSLTLTITQTIMFIRIYFIHNLII